MLSYSELFYWSAYLWCSGGSLCIVFSYFIIHLWTPLLTMQQSTASPVSCFPYAYMTIQRYPCDNGRNLSSWSTCPVKSSTIYLFIYYYFFPPLKLRISWLSQPSLIAECGQQLVHKIAWYLSQSVGFKNKQQFLTTKAVIKQAGFHKSRTRKMHQKCCLFVLHSRSYLNNALLEINHGHVVLCFFRMKHRTGYRGPGEQNVIIDYHVHRK